MVQAPQPCEDLIPLSLIRKHLKIDDYQGVDDEQLQLYASASVEQFQKYTGLLVGKRRQITEPIRVPQWTSLVQAAKARFLVGVSHPINDSSILIEWNGRTHMLNVIPGVMEFEWPLWFCRPSLHIWNLWSMWGLQNGCASCGIVTETIPNVSYMTGTGDGLAPGALLGCLKYIAWQFEHPGDELATLTDKAMRSSASGQQGTNNALVGSGAYAEWHQYKPRVAR